MALSIISWRGESGGHQDFDVEIGRNQYYTWAIGSGSQKRDGIRMLHSRSQTSPLLGPLEGGSRGRAVLRIPADAFTSDDHHLQLLSFRDEELRGPAASDIIEVPWRWSPRHETPADDRPHVPSLSTVDSAAPAPLQRLSHAQFLDVLAGIVSKVLPMVGKAIPIVSSLFGGTPAATPAPAGQATSPAGQAAPDLVQLLNQLLAQIQQAAGARTVALPGAGTHTLSVQRRYSYASWAPLLAALPALAPVLQQVLTPQTIQSLIAAGDPTKLLQVGINGILEAARIGQEATNKLHEHLRALNPGLGDDVLIPLLAAMSMSAGRLSGKPKHLISRRVRIGVADLAPVELAGYPQVVFKQGDVIAMPITVDTPQPIPRARLLLCLKDAETLRWVAEKVWSFDRVYGGRLSTPVVLPAAVTHQLKPGREYVIDLTLTWRGRSGLVGASTSQLIRVVGESVFDSMDSGGRPVRLDDIDRDRDWWHRVWAHEIDDRSSRIDAHLVYTYRLRPLPVSRNRRLETEEDLDQARSRRSEGVLVSGLEVSLGELSRLAQRLTGAAFDEQAMAALSDPEFARVFDRSAHSTLTVRGGRRDRVAIWVWPEVKVHKVLLRVPADTSPVTGQVLSFTQVAVDVPVPGLCHVVSTRSG